MNITKTHFESMLEDYKTIPSKKSFCTRCIKSHKDYLSDLQKAYSQRKKDSNYGWHLGEKVFSGTISNAEREIEMMQKVKASL